MKQNNAINIIYPYRTEIGTWVYDDKDCNTFKEPFVLGSSEAIDYLVGKDCNKCECIISSSSIPDYSAKLLKLNEPEITGGIEGWYNIEGTPIIHWLCGKTLDYFPSYPDTMYVKLKKL